MKACTFVVLTMLAAAGSFHASLLAHHSNVGFAVETVNTAFKEAASDKSYKGVVEYTDEPLVSQDIIGNPHSCIFDSKLTLMLGNRFVKVVGWYDNEWGYSNRCVELLELLGK